MRGKHRRRRPPPGPISLSAVMVGVLAMSLAPHPSGGAAGHARNGAAATARLPRLRHRDAPKLPDGSRSRRRATS